VREHAAAFVKVVEAVACERLGELPEEYDASFDLTPEEWEEKRERWARQWARLQTRSVWVELTAPNTLKAKQDGPVFADEGPRSSS
jgi:hypothetical protein